MHYRIFLSYRRSDAAAQAGRLFDSLKSSLGKSIVFQDVEEIKPGEKWADRLEKTLLECSVVLAVIGPDWLSAKDEHHRRRIDDEADWVRKEIETARKITSSPETKKSLLIPILVENGGRLWPARDKSYANFQSLNKPTFSLGHSGIKKDIQD
ncbi:MAG: toll/interleukin-1 receptor domain-containing protein [Lewinellaceae bacterium]|nr:toll/interleukin-1 receptor domain-containing protein [Lewinellaceae bacterium]